MLSLSWNLFLIENDFMSVDNIRGKQQQSFGENSIYKHPISATNFGNEKEIQMCSKYYKYLKSS